MSLFINEAKIFIKKISSDTITGYAAQSCFYITLSFLPFLLLIINLTNYLPLTHEDIIKLVANIAPIQLKSILTDVILDIYENSNPTLTSITAITALWSAGRGFTAIIHGLNTIYKADYVTGWFKLRIKSTVYTIIFILLISLTLTLLVFGESLNNIIKTTLPALSNLLTTLLGQKIILFPLLFTGMFTIIYTYIPNRKSSLRKELPGAVITALGWYIFSNLYSLYVAYSPGFSYMYRGLTALIFALLWIYFSVIILLFGAEINYWINKKYFNKNILL